MAKIKADFQDLKIEAWLRAREAGKIVWVTREGKQIPIKEMTDTHLCNTLKMLERQAEEKEELSIEEWELRGLTLEDIC